MADELVTFRLTMRPRSAPGDIRPALEEYRKLLLRDIRDRMRAKAPRGIRRHIRVTRASVRVDHRAALYVEHGMEALGDRPVSPRGLEPWVTAIGKDPRSAFAIAWAIGRRGIKARPFIAPAIKAALGQSTRLFGRAWQSHFQRE